MVCGSTKKGNKMKYRIVFIAKFETIVEVNDDYSLDDAIGDLNIPEEDGVRYKPDTFEVLTYEVVE